MIFKGIKGLI